MVISLLEQMYENQNAVLTKEVNKMKDMNKKQLLNEIAMIMLKYNIKDSEMDITKAEQSKAYTNICNKINAMFTNEYKLEEKTVKKILFESAIDSYYINSFISNFDINYNLKVVSDEELEKIINQKISGDIWSNRLWNNKVELRKDVKLQIKKFLNGDITVNEISSIIEKKYKNNKYVTSRLVNDNIAHVQEEANKKWKKKHNIKTDLYLGTLDYKICNKCIPYDGQVFSVDEGPEPPIHVGCRCTRVAVVEGWTPTARIDNITKKNIPWTTYEKWKNKI